MMKSEKEVIQIIDKILQLIYDGTDEELNEAIHEMEASVPFYSKIYNMIFFSNEELTAEEIYQKAKPIENVIMPLSVRQTLSTGYCSDNYVRLLLFSDINYWTD